MRRGGLDAWRCARGHLHLHGGPVCPACGAPLRAARVAPDARVVAFTTVRVAPGGSPFVLGIAQTRCGRARTLCVVATPLRGSGHDAVRLSNEDGVIVARAGRLSADSRVQHPTREDWQES